MLPFSRETIETYTKEHRLKWREDSSNATTKYVRNKLRHDVIPILKEINPSLLQSFQNTIQNLQASSNIVNDRIEELIKGAIIKLTSSGFKLDILEIKKFHNPKAYLYQFLNGYGFTEWDDVTNLLDAQSGKQIFSKNWRLIKDRNYLLLSELIENQHFSIEILETNKQVQTPIGSLFFDEVDAILEIHRAVIYIDKKTIKFPLTVRKWEAGDVFFPLGMSGKKKKVSKYLKDEKTSLLDKEQTFVLCSENEIVWLIGKRADNRYKVTEKTECILKIEIK